MVPGIDIKDQIVGTLLGSLESQLGSIQKKALAAAQVCLLNINWGIFLASSFADLNSCTEKWIQRPIGIIGASS